MCILYIEWVECIEGIFHSWIFSCNITQFFFLVVFSAALTFSLPFHTVALSNKLLVCSMSSAHEWWWHLDFICLRNVCSLLLWQKTNNNNDKKMIRPKKNEHESSVTQILLFFFYFHFTALLHWAMIYANVHISFFLSPLHSFSTANYIWVHVYRMTMLLHQLNKHCSTRSSYDTTESKLITLLRKQSKSWM